jgi:tetratricopeptide (TPR) repeat protein
MAIKGSLREASLADVLQLLALGRKSGCLSVADRSSFGRIYFDEGRITHASIINRRDRLGDLLVKNGAVPRQALEAALEEQQGPNPRRLGEILIERGTITREQLGRFIRIQIEEAVYFLFTWNQGTFTFEAGEVPDVGETLVSINPEALLLEGARRVDEWTLIEKKIPSFDLVFALDLSHGDPTASELTRDQQRIVRLIDDRRSVREIVEESGLLEFEACKALFGLIQAGFARHSGRKREASGEQRPRPGRVHEHANLGIAFYRTSMHEEAGREFLRILELEPGHLESLFYLSLIDLRRNDPRSAIRRLMRLIEQGGNWASAFHNLALALEMAGRTEEALLAVENALANFPQDRSLLLSRAILLTRLGRFGAACGAFEMYRETPGGVAPPPAAYFAYSIVALAGVGRTGEAEQRTKEGLALHPRSAALLANAAAVRERASATEEAEGLYRRAADENPGIVQAQRGLADSLYRRGAYDAAGAIYTRLLERNGSSAADLQFKLGNIAYKRGDREAAVLHWRETLRADPANAIARTNLELVEGALAGRNA